MITICEAAHQHPVLWYIFYQTSFGWLGGFLIGRTLAVLLTLTLGTSMAVRQGPIAMAAHQICSQVWLAVSLLTDALGAAAQVILSRSFSCIFLSWAHVALLFKIALIY